MADCCVLSSPVRDALVLPSLGLASGLLAALRLFFGRRLSGR